MSFIKSLQKNIGGIDQRIRFVVGLAFLSLVYFLPTPKNYIGLLGLIPLTTAFIRYCPLYKIIGVNTDTHKDKKQ